MSEEVTFETVFIGRVSLDLPVKRRQGRRMDIIHDVTLMRSSNIEDPVRAERTKLLARFSDDPEVLVSEEQDGDLWISTFRSRGAELGATAVRGVATVGSVPVVLKLGTGNEGLENGKKAMLRVGKSLTEANGSAGYYIFDDLMAAFRYEGFTERTDVSYNVEGYGAVEIVIATNGDLLEEGLASSSAKALEDLTAVFGKTAEVAEARSVSNGIFEGEATLVTLPDEAGTLCAWRSLGAVRAPDRPYIDIVLTGEASAEAAEAFMSRIVRSIKTTGKPR